ncbi:MAG TPA: Bax inhibitor-1/YccA family protein [Terracidiphilus sp.]|nr:Bax inhibitor-1/YccA family protein [Terracidiphilus sp.]
MPLIKTSNPALGQNTFRDVAGSGYGYGGAIDATTRMTLSGTVNKTAILLLCAVATAAWTWHLFVTSHDIAAVSGLMMVGLFGGMITAFVTIFKKEWSPVCAPVYALLEGLAMGGISAVFEMRYPGIAFEAVGLSFTTLFVMLFLYRARIIKVTQKFMIGVVAATGGIMLFYFVEMLLGFFGIHMFASLNGAGPIGIGFSLFIVAIAALNLVLDFAFIEQGVNAGAPKYMEWYGAFGIMVTLVWLYLEMLRLLSKINSNR